MTLVLSLSHGTQHIHLNIRHKNRLHRYCTHTELHPQGGIFFLVPAGGSNPAGP